MFTEKLKLAHSKEVWKQNVKVKQFGNQRRQQQVETLRKTWNLINTQTNKQTNCFKVSTKIRLPLNYVIKYEPFDNRARIEFDLLLSDRHDLFCFSKFNTLLLPFDNLFWSVCIFFKFSILYKSIVFHANSVFFSLNQGCNNKTAIQLSNQKCSIPTCRFKYSDHEVCMC